MLIKHWFLKKNKLEILNNICYNTYSDEYEKDKKKSKMEKRISPIINFNLFYNSNFQFNKHDKMEIKF